MSPALVLDVPTLFKLMFLVDMVVCLLLTAYRAEAHYAEAIRGFVLGRLLHGSACLLLGLGGLLPPALSLILPTSMVFLGYSLEGATIARLRGLGRLQSVIPVCIALIGIGFVHLGTWSQPYLIGIASGFVSLMCLYTSLAIVLPAHRTRLVWMMFGVFLLNCVASAVRSYSGFFDGVSLNDSSVPQTSGLVAAYIYCVGGGVGFLLFLKEEADRALLRRAQSDPLTGLLNRRAFFEALGEGLAACELGRSPLSLLCFDLDYFKSVNDTYGHQAGDEVLCKVSAVVAATLTAHGFSTRPGRIGGEEFAAFMPCNAAGATQIAEAVRLAVMGTRFSGVPGLTCTASIGVAEALSVGDTLQSLVRRCDLALYEAKARGRNQVVLLNSQLTTRPTKGSSRNVWATSIP